MLVALFSERESHAVFFGQEQSMSRLVAVNYMSHGIAKKAGLNRESLYKALGEAGNPEFGTVMRIVGALGLTLSARPATDGQASRRRRVA